MEIGKLVSTFKDLNENTSKYKVSQNYNSYSNKETIDKDLEEEYLNHNLVLIFKIFHLLTTWVTFFY